MIRTRTRTVITIFSNFVIISIIIIILYLFMFLLLFLVVVLLLLLLLLLLWLVGAERRRQIWRKSAVKVTERECCQLVLNAIFYLEPVEFCQKRCDVIALRFSHDKLQALFWVFCKRAICSLAIPAKVALP